MVNQSNYAILADVSTYHTLSVYIPYTSISTNTYILPPPTTIVGALAYAYKRALNNFKELDENGFSPALELIEKKEVLYAAAGIVKPVIISKSIERVYQQIYLRKQYWEITERAYAIGLRPVVVVDKLRIFIITNNKELARYCYAITRLGRKESLVSVDNVFVAPVKEILTKLEICRTSFYFPLKIAKDYSKDFWTVVDMPILHKDNYIKTSTRLEPYVVPKEYVGEKNLVQLNEDGVVLKMKTADGEIEEIVTPRQVLEN